MPLPRFNAPNLGIAPSASEVIAKHLRDAIISGQFAEDEPIRQDDIAGLFNVSKIPVREALKRLEAEGLVMFQRNKGAVVTRISEPELALTENVYSYIGRAYNLTGGYNIQLRNPLYELQPSVFMKTDMQSFQTDITARLVYNKMFNGGLSWRVNESVVLSIGALIGGFQVGYAYDFPTSAILKGSTGSHELMIRYKLKLTKTKTGKNKHKSVRIL